MNSSASMEAKAPFDDDQNGLGESNSPVIDATTSIISNGASGTLHGENKFQSAISAWRSEPWGYSMTVPTPTDYNYFRH